MGSSDSKESVCNAEDLSSTPGSGNSPGEGNGSPVQYSWLQNSIDRGAWWTTVHGVSKELNKIEQHFHFEPPSDSAVKEYICNAGDSGLILGWGRFPGEGNGNPLQYSCLENPMNRGDWWTTVHRVSKE